MTIFCIEGGIGTGKTTTGINLAIKDLRDGRKLFTNSKITNVTKEQEKRITYLTKEEVANIFQLVKEGKFNLQNSVIFISEMHNYLDSRNSMSKKNKLFTYFILQSRHAGKESCDIIYDTQEIGQVDRRLRRNTDHLIRPTILTKHEDGKPIHIQLNGVAKVGHKWVNYVKMIDVTDTVDCFDTHELIDFEV